MIIENIQCRKIVLKIIFIKLILNLNYLKYIVFR